MGSDLSYLKPGLVPAVLNSHLQAAVTEYGIFWELWPQVRMMGSERQTVGFEVELIGCHTSDPAHLDPSCVRCQRVRSAILAIADAVIREMTFSSPDITYDIDSHANSITCSAALGNRPLVSVSINISFRDADQRSVGTNIVHDITQCLAMWGIHQH